MKITRTFIECDRCHKTQEYAVDKKPSIHVTFNNDTSGFDYYFEFDLCDECRKELGRWLCAGEEKAKE